MLPQDDIEIPPGISADSTALSDQKKTNESQTLKADFIKTFFFQEQLHVLKHLS